MKQLLILHCLGGGPQINWYPWLAQKAKELGYQVIAPQLPEPKSPNLRLSYECVMQQMEFDKETVIVGHSSGAVLTLGVLQLLPRNIFVKRAILVAGFVDPQLTDELFRYVSPEQYSNLFPVKWHWPKIKKSAQDFIIFQSSNDPYIQMRHAKYLERVLDGELVVVSDAKHFSIGSGGPQFKSFPQVLEYL